MRVFVLTAAFACAALVASAGEVTHYQSQITVRCDGVERHMLYAEDSLSPVGTMYVIPNGPVLLEQHIHSARYEFGQLNSDTLSQGSLFDAWVFVNDELEAAGYGRWTGPYGTNCVVS